MIHSERPLHITRFGVTSIIFIVSLAVSIVLVRLCIMMLHRKFSNEYKIKYYIAQLYIKSPKISRFILVPLGRLICCLVYLLPLLAIVTAYPPLIGLRKARMLYARKIPYFTQNLIRNLTNIYSEYVFNFFSSIIFGAYIIFFCAGIPFSRHIRFHIMQALLLSLLNYPINTAFVEVTQRQIFSSFIMRPVGGALNSFGVFGIIFIMFRVLMGKYTNIPLISETVRVYSKHLPNKSIRRI